jgi:Na+-driven multidrug efflux pump
MLTNDPTLQKLLKELLPMFGLSNASMALTTMAWTLLGAQGRYRLATVVVGLVSWTVTLPLAAFYSVYLEMDLQGQTSALVIGYLLAGMIHAYYLFRSDWAAMSKNVMDDNASVGNAGDSSSSSSSSAGLSSDRTE